MTLSKFPLADKQEILWFIRCRPWVQNINWLHLHIVQITKDTTSSVHILIYPSRVFGWNLVICCTSCSSWCEIRIMELLKILYVVIEDNFILITHLENPTCEDAAHKHSVHMIFFLSEERFRVLIFIHTSGLIVFTVPLRDTIPEYLLVPVFCLLWLCHYVHLHFLPCLFATWITLQKQVSTYDCCIGNEWRVSSLWHLVKNSSMWPVFKVMLHEATKRQRIVSDDKKWRGGHAWTVGTVFLVVKINMEKRDLGLFSISW